MVYPPLCESCIVKTNHRFTPLDTYCIEYILFQKFKLLDKSLISKGPLSNGGARENIKYQ